MNKFVTGAHKIYLDKDFMNLSRADQLASVLKMTNQRLLKFDPTKHRPVNLSTGSARSVESVSELVQTTAKAKITQYPGLLEAVYDKGVMFEVLKELAEKTNVLVSDSPREIVVPEEYKKLTLNLDQSHGGRDLKYFMTTPDEIISEISGSVYCRVLGMKDEQAIEIARKVVPQYLPRNKPGIIKQKNLGKEELATFNSYIPPAWMTYEGKTPSTLPKLFEKLVQHLFPLKVEREYFYDWLHASLFSRAFVYLILCGPGGTGKNRLKLVLRALHGHANTVDGKRSTLNERFNSQLGDATLAWFDELHYDLNMENVMKELQNDSISIEKKGVDASRSTKIYASLAISNNKPRDNYIAFDARKFVPLQITPHRLETSMDPKDINDLTNKVENWSSDTFDIAFVAQIGRWLQKRGRTKQWPLLEYKGPMFYKLAHTSMSRWQKKAASIILDGSMSKSSRVTIDPKKGYLWSTVADQSMKKNGDRSQQFPDYSTVQHLFDIFVDGKGQKTFKTVAVPRDVMGDFYVKVINTKAHIMTESEVLEEIGGDDEEDDEIGLL